MSSELVDPLERDLGIAVGMLAVAFPGCSRAEDRLSRSRPPTPEAPA